MRPRLWLAAPLLALTAAAGALTFAPGPMVFARDADGRRVATLKLQPSGRFDLEYVHSYYRAPARESFVALEDGRLRLASLASTSEAVLDYYALSGVKRRRGRWIVLTPRASPPYDELPLIATRTGRRTLAAGGRRVPLFRRGGPRHLTIGVSPGSPLVAPRERLRSLLVS